MDYEVTEDFLDDCGALLEKSATEGKEDFGFIEGREDGQKIFLEGISEPPEDAEGKKYRRGFGGIVYFEEFGDIFRELIEDGDRIIGHIHTHFTDQGMSYTDEDFFGKYDKLYKKRPVFSIVSPDSLVIRYGNSKRELDVSGTFSFSDDLKDKQEMYRNIGEAYSNTLDPTSLDDIYKRGLEAAKKDDMERVRAIGEEARSMAYMALWD